MKYLVTSLFLLVVSALDVRAEVDPNFYIFLCFGQSNMQGSSPPEDVDMEYVDERFQMLACENFTKPSRVMGQWYTAYPPIVRQETYLGVSDYFGRTMVAALPADIKVGVVNVSCGGVGITAFMSERVHEYNLQGVYNNDPYRRLVDMAKIAQKDGVIKGILMHQGESNWGQWDWPEKVNTVYSRLLSDLGLNAAEVPLLVGELVAESEGGQFAEHNPVIATVPSVIPTAHIISSEGVKPSADHMHFSLEGNRLMGKRYALEMLSLLGFPTFVDANYQLPNNLHRLYKAITLSNYDDISLEPNDTYNIIVTAYFEDGHTENVTSDVVINCSGDGVIVNGNQLTAVSKKSTLVTISYTDFIRETVSTSFYVNKSALPDVILTANDFSREYGEPNPAFDYTMEGGNTYGTPDFYCEATELSPVGTYPIKLSTDNITDVNVTSKDGILTITPARLTITVKDCSREEGQDNPDFEVTYEGFKNGETEDVLIQKPVVTTTATKESEVGTYDLEISGAEAQNYTISYINGTLTVTEITEESGMDGILFFADDMQDVTIYSLSGQLVGRTKQKDIDGVWQQLPRGVYIVNGKKKVK
jgi:hypothetical protein